MRRLLFLPLLAFAASALLAQTAPSQPPQAQTGYTTPVFNATTRNVILDVIVTDQKGQPVTGLKRDDFRIYEDKAPQKIQSFEAITAAASAESAPRTILLVDEMNTRFEDMAYTRYSLNKLLARGGAQLDQPTALYVLANDGLHVLQEYTRDPAAIDTALRKHKSVLSHMDDDSSSPIDRIDISLTALQQIAMANMGISGHKNVVWISPGFPIFSGIEMSQEGQKELFDTIRRLSDQMLQARISIYGVDPRGIEPQLEVTGHVSTSLIFTQYIDSVAKANRIGFGDVALEALAKQTGGHVFHGRNDVDKDIATSIADANNYYTLSYSPQNRDFHGEFRRLRVGIVDKPTLTTQTEDGYYAIPDGQPANPQRQMQELTSSLIAPFTYTGIPIPTTSTTVTPSQISVRFVVPAASLTWAADAQGQLHTTLSVMAADKDKSGKWEERVGRVYTFTLPSGATPADRGTSVHFDMPYNRSDQLRFVVRDDASGRLGSSEVTVDRPKPA